MDVEQRSSSAPAYQAKLNHLLELQKQTSDQPYSIIHRLKLAKSYRGLGYPDLAAGEAYKALLLVDEVVEETEFFEEALDAALADLPISPGPTETDHSGCVCESGLEEAGVNNDERVTELAKACWSRTAYISPIIVADNG
jgi:hypothetical protein